MRARAIAASSGRDREPFCIALYPMRQGAACTFLTMGTALVAELKAPKLPAVAVQPQLKNADGYSSGEVQKGHHSGAKTAAIASGL